MLGTRQARSPGGTFVRPLAPPPPAPPSASMAMSLTCTVPPVARPSWPSVLRYTGPRLANSYSQDIADDILLTNSGFFFSYAMLGLLLIVVGAWVLHCVLRMHPRDCKGNNESPKEQKTVAAAEPTPGTPPAPMDLPQLPSVDLGSRATLESTASSALCPTILRTGSRVALSLSPE